MKIAYVVYDYQKPGGIEKYVRVLAEKFGREHEVHVITARPQRNNPAIRFHQVYVFRYLPAFLKLIQFAKMAERELRGGQYDIIHSQGADCRIHNVITAHSCHKAWVEKAKNFGLWERFKKAVNPLHAAVLRNERYNYGHILRGVAVSREVKKEIQEYYAVPDGLIDVIYPGVEIKEEDSEKRDEYRDSVRKMMGIAANDFVILFVSHEFRRKGLSSAINALSLLKNKNVKLLVVGGGNRIPYIWRAGIKGVREQVLFAGASGRVAEYYAASDLFLLPTKHEAFGMVITEAMSFGLPVIVSRCAGAAELIQDQNCLLEDPLNAREIAEKIRVFLSDRERAETTGISLKKTAEKYTWDAMAERTMDTYRKAAGL